jgi:hypothetical protein
MARLSFIVRVSVIVAVVVVAKVAAHFVGWEPISLNALFTGIIAANVFLMGFLLSGVLADYKESERLPGELSACLENMAQEVAGIGLGKDKPDVRPCLDRIAQIGQDIFDWFYKRTSTEHLLAGIDDLTIQLARIEPQTQATFIARVKQEQSTLRRTMIRIETIRETSFVSSGYLLAELITVLLIGGLVLISQDPFYESLLFTGVIAFLLVFLLLLIKDLDNPFGYYERFSGADVTLDPFARSISRLKAMAGGLSEESPVASVAGWDGRGA